MSKALENLINELDAAIKKGDTSYAKAKLQSLALREIPRENRVRYAELSRRLNLGNLSLKALAPYVRPSGRKVVIPTAAEKVEYGAALSRIGATDEAIAIFDSVDPKEAWSVLILEAYALFSKWQYHEAIPLLERYISGPDLSEYQRLVGEVNLAAAHIYEENPAANIHLEKLLTETCSQNHRYLYGYALQLKAENSIWQKRWLEARKELLAAQEIYQTADSLESLFVQKWLRIIELYCNPNSKNLESLMKVSEEALKRRHWETLRSIDYHVALAIQDKKLISRFLFGTPFHSLKARLLKDLSSVPKVPEEYEWTIKETGVSPHVFSLETFSKGKGAPKMGSTLYRLVETLTTDFYRPFRPAEIHSRIFKGEYYNPDTSAHRVAQTVNRLRRHWESIRSPMEIIEERGEYRLSCKKSCSVKIVNPVRAVLDTNHLQLAELEKKIGPSLFDVGQVEASLKLPNWTAKRLLFWGVNQSRLVKTGKGKSTSYQFLTEVTEKKAA